MGAALAMLGAAALNAQTLQWNCGDCKEGSSCEPTNTVTATLDVAKRTLTISGKGAMKTEYEKPWADYSDAISSIIINQGVTTIGDRSFYGAR